MRGNDALQDAATAWPLRFGVRKLQSGLCPILPLSPH